jgi:SpoVK/Ycf46/Vps4 family AAA+-type ATPase
MAISNNFPPMWGNNNSTARGQMSSGSSTKGGGMTLGEKALIQAYRSGMQIPEGLKGQLIQALQKEAINKNNMSKRKNFRTGERVALMKYYSSNDENPVWGDNNNYIAGTVESLDSYDNEIIIKWDNGMRNDYDLDDSDTQIDTLDSANQKIKKTFFGGEKINLKTDELDALVIDDESKQEVFAVLKQHQNSKKIFEDWGLGKVIEYGRGMTMMFHGNPGTGKTWGANCIAKSLNTELLTLNGGNIQTSEPGGANRNISQAFATAKAQGKVLFLDECDSLITVREEVGMILASEINTLLTEIEKFEGVCILATNRIGTLDPALERRISLIMEFPEPDFYAREKIWEKMLPPEMPLGKGVNAKKLAEESLTGGQIKNAVLQSARFAVAEEKDEVSLAHFDKAISRIHASKSLMGNKRNRYRALGQDVGVGTSTGKGKEMGTDIVMDKVRTDTGVKKVARKVPSKKVK